MNRVRRMAGAMLFCSAMLTGLSGGLNAADRVWTSPISGQFSDTARWTGGLVAGGDDNALFQNYTNFSAFKVTLTGATTNQRLRLLPSANTRFAMTLDLAGFPYAATNTISEALVVNQSGTAGTLVALTVTNSDAAATVFEARRFRIADSTGAGVLTLAGLNVGMQVAKTDNYVGAGGAGSLTIADGASLFWSGAIYVPAGGAAFGTTRVTRASLVVNNPSSGGTLGIGRRGKGIVYLDGAYVSRTNTTYLLGINVGDGAPDSGPVVNSFGELQMSGGSVATNLGEVKIGNLAGGRAVVAGGSTLHTLSQMSMAHGSGGNYATTNYQCYGSLLVTDDGSRVQVDGPRVTVGTYGYADVVVSNHAVMGVSGSEGMTLDDRSGLTVANARLVCTRLITTTNSSVTFMLGDLPRNSPLVALSGNLTLASLTTLGVKVLDGTSLNVGETISLLSYAGSRTGTFQDLPEGAAFHAEGRRFRIFYGDGSNDAITLKYLPQGTTLMVY